MKIRSRCFLGTVLIGVAVFGTEVAFTSFLKEKPEETPQYIKSIYSIPLTFDPVLMNDTSSLTASQLLYQGLLRFDSDLQLKGDLAESWTTNPEGTQIHFRLRPHSTFHNGIPVTAGNVVRSLERLIAPGSWSCPYKTRPASG